MDEREYTAPPREYDPRSVPETAALPPEDPPLPREDPALPPEEPPLPPEFGAYGDAAPPPKKKRRLRKWAYAAAMAAVIFYTAAALPGRTLPVMPQPGPASSDPAPAVSASPEPSASPDAPTPTPTPDPTPTPTPEPTPEPTPTYPLGDETLYITVFNDSFNFDNITDEEFSWLTILAKFEIPASEFTGYDLPEPVEDQFTEDFTPVGYVLHYGAAFDPGIDTLTMDTPPFAIRLENARLTVEDAEKIPLNTDGNRYLNVHVLWEPVDPTNGLSELLTFDPQNGDPIFSYPLFSPVASEGYLYLMLIPEPERDGYTFTGWYTEDGIKIDFLNYFDFYEYDEEAGDWDYEHPIPIPLFAGWELTD